VWFLFPPALSALIIAGRLSSDIPVIFLSSSPSPLKNSVMIEVNSSCTILLSVSRFITANRLSCTARFLAMRSSLAPFAFKVLACSEYSIFLMAKPGLEIRTMNTISGDSKQNL